MSPFDPKIHHRRSIRLPGYDYSQAGAYYVTIVTHNRDMLFGEVIDGEMKLNDFGKVVQEEWERTAIVRPNIELGAYMVMPNHFHGILIITDAVVGASRRLAPTTDAISPKPGSLGAIMAQFKSIVTKRIWKLDENMNGTPIWQRNYYEHIIRNDREMGKIWRYIESNPVTWNPMKKTPTT